MSEKEKLENAEVEIEEVVPDENGAAEYKLKTVRLWKDGRDLGTYTNKDVTPVKEEELE